MKPLSQHWADQTAARLVNQLGEKQQYVLASGITPSGTVHIGNFREVVTVDLVARALKDAGHKVRFIYSWDDFDTLRKVPKNLPMQDMLRENLRRPISHVPDPYGKEESYARANEVAFEKDLAAVGIDPEFLYQHERYGSGMYAASIREALERRLEIKALLDQHRREPYPDTWLPTSIFCEACGRDEMVRETYDGEWNYSYECASCGHKATTDIRKTKNLKLLWRTDWPMRWAFEQVDFEPGGKDHSSDGGSYDTGKEIVKKIWDREAPIYLQYDFVSIKGLDGKMSSSAGVLLTLGEALSVYDPQMVRWIFAAQRPNHDFSLAFDEDVIKVYEEFDRSEAMAYEDGDRNNKKWLTNRRIYELSTVDGRVADRRPFRPSFRGLCNRLQICDGDIERTLDRFYADEIVDDADRASFKKRAACAWFWLEQYAPESFRYKLHGSRVSIPMQDEQERAIACLRALVDSDDLDSIDPKDLNQKIYDDVIRASGIDAKLFFSAVYQKLIGREQGPRLPSFLKEVGRQKLLELL